MRASHGRHLKQPKQLLQLPKYRHIAVAIVVLLATLSIKMSSLAASQPGEARGKENVNVKGGGGKQQGKQKQGSWGQEKTQSQGSWGQKQVDLKGKENVNVKGGEGKQQGKVQNQGSWGQMQGQKQRSWGQTGTNQQESNVNQCSGQSQAVLQPKVQGSWSCGWKPQGHQSPLQGSVNQQRNQGGSNVPQGLMQQPNQAPQGSAYQQRDSGQNQSSSGSVQRPMQQPKQGPQNSQVNQGSGYQQRGQSSWGQPNTQAVPPSQGSMQQQTQGHQASKLNRENVCQRRTQDPSKEQQKLQLKGVNEQNPEIQQRQQPSYELLQPPGSLKRGTIGKPGQVAVNYLDVDMSKMPAVAYHYDVKILPERPKKFYRDAFEQFRVKYLNDAIAAYDGRASCYSVDKLNTPTLGGDVKVTDCHGRSLHYNVQVKETVGFEVDLNSLRSYMKDKIYDKPMYAMQCLEVVLASPCHKKALRVGRSFFKMSEPGQRLELGDGYECLIGLYQAFVLGDRPFVNVDISHKSFPIAMPVLEYIERYVLQGSITHSTQLDQVASVIENFLKGINVIYQPPPSFNSAPRVFKVNGLTSMPARYQKFQLDDKTLTVEEYFRSRSYTLKYPNLHCLYVGPQAKNIFLPIELCRIEGGQSLNRKDGSNQVAAMIKYAATSTNERKAKIVNLLKFMQHNLDPTISRFGISIHNDFIMVHTRILTPPLVEYKNKQISTVRNGSWRMDQRAQFLEPKARLHKWAILHSSGHRRLMYNQVADFGNMFRRQAVSVNVSLAETPDIRPFRDIRELDNCFDDLKRSNCDLVIVIIPNSGVSYDDIKQKAELKHGILTQCIKQFTIERKLNPQLIGNILLKVNSKLNGINHKLKDEPTRLLANAMFLGADVTHPSPDQREIPSVVGVAASHDLYGAAYNMQYRLQRSTLEEIEDMEAIVLEHLRIYHGYRKRYPDHIIYYRDGVSDGQFPKIKSLELRGINAACAKLGIKVKLCCVIVVKRHHTRFFPTGSPTQFNKFNNVDPGTVVDRVIVHPNEIQFFMVSHQSIQGTAKPTRYNVIENTGGLDIDLLQQLTYNLCHMFPRCTRSVSYPAPAYLAHLVAARGRVYLTGTQLFKSPKEEYKKRLIVPALLSANPMYFV